jgi:hypothetical protein
LGNYNNKRYLLNKKLMEFIEILNENRKDDFKSKYSNKFSPEQISEMVNNVMPKYLNWVGSVIDSVNFDANFETITNALNIFTKISTNLPITDLYQYKSLGQLLTALSDYSQKQRRKIKKVEGGNVVYEDGRFFIVNPLTHTSSCYYGKGTKWCTTNESDNYFTKYNDDGKLFYIIDKTLPTSDPYYKVALLQKFDGGKIYYNALDNSFNDGWIFGSDKFNEISSAIDGYLNSEYAEQLKIFSDKETAKKEKERLERLRIQRENQRKEEEAQQRREDNEWELNEGCPEEGIKAHALLRFLVDNSEVEALTDEDKVEMQRLKSEIDRLEEEYGVSGDDDLLDEKSDLEDELAELEEKIDVYNIIPDGHDYGMTQFEILKAGLDGREYVVGDENQTDRAAHEAVESLLDDVGYEGFNKSFLEDYIDGQQVIDDAEERIGYDINESPESYFDDEDRELSNEQEEKITILEGRIENYKSTISDMEDEMDGGEDDDDIQEKIDELNELIEEMEQDIEDIKDDPQGDFPQDLMDNMLEERLDEVRRDVMGYINNWGLEMEYYIDKEALIDGIVETDGYGNAISTYDGDVHESYVLDTLYYVFRRN